MKYEKWRFSSRFISKTIQDKAIDTMEDEQELVCDLLNGAIFLMTLSDH